MRSGPPWGPGRSGGTGVRRGRKTSGSGSVGARGGERARHGLRRGSRRSRDNRWRYRRGKWGVPSGGELKK